jgi:rare lipoprotein A
VEVETILAQGGPAPTYAAAPPPLVAAAVLREPKAPAPGDNGSAARADAGGHFLQLAAFSSLENAERFVERVRAQLLDGGEVQLRVVTAGSFHRVQAGPYADRSAAVQAAQGIGQALGAAPILTAPR